MSKKKLLEFGLKEADAFQKNFKIIFDRLVRGYKSMMGKEPEGLDLLKVKMEAREKALGTTKVVNQKGLTLDPDKPITGGTQEGIPTIKTKFDEELDEFNLSKDDPMGDLEKIVKGEGETGLPKKEIPRDVKETFEEELGVKLYGDETFDELMIIKNTGKHPRDMADGGQVPAAPSQLVSESDMILGYRGPGEYQGGRSSREAADNRDRGRTEQYSRPSAPRDLGFIDDLVVSSELEKKGPDIRSFPARDPRFAGYTPSGFDPGRRNIFQKGLDLVKRTATNPFVQSFGLGILGGPMGAKFGLTREIDMFNKARAVKGLYDRIGPMADQTIEDVLEEETEQTTALYRDGGLATMFVEKR
jgi:hypothetical protein